MFLAASFPFLEVFWTMLIFFAFVIWLWILFTVITDLFRRRDISGFKKVLWIIGVIVFPYVGTFIYLIAEHNGMTERSLTAQEEAKRQFDQYVQSVAPASDPASVIADAKKLLDEGTIDQAEFERLKAKALAA